MPIKSCTGIPPSSKLGGDNSTVESMAKSSLIPFMGLEDVYGFSQGLSKSANACKDTGFHSAARPPVMKGHSPESHSTAVKSAVNGLGLGCCGSVCRLLN